MDKASFSGKILPLIRVWRFSRKPLRHELSIPLSGFTFATGTYLTGVTEIPSEGSRFGRPSYKLAPRRRYSLPFKEPQGNVQEIDAVHKFVNMLEIMNKRLYSLLL